MAGRIWDDSEIEHQVQEFPLVDVIFVHGLCGSPNRTWTTWDDPTWLQDSIPSLKRARIIPWAYDIQPCHRDLFDRAAENLLHDLKVDGDITPDRPLVFVAHSFGGMLLKKALLSAQENSALFPNILRIVGIVFIATPHGSAIRPWMNEIVSNISSNDEHPMPIVEKLWEMSEELLAASGAFQRVYGLFNVVQLCEEGWLGCPESCIEHSDCLSSVALQIPIFGNRRHHYTIPESYSQDEFNLVVGRSVSRSMFALSTTKGNDSDLHRGPIQEQCPGTCEWIFTSRQYDEWLTQSDRPCLWLFGRGGSGKSTLLSTVASRLLTHPPERGGIVYFFVDQGHESVATARTLLRTILHAMKDRGQVSWGPKLLEVLAELEEVTVAISREKFQTLLRKILLGLKVDSQLILVLDGLEDDDSMKSVILDEVVEISSGRLNTRKVKCIISSRSSCSPALHFDACLKIDMDTEPGVRQDIFIYATTQFRGLETRMTTNLEPVARALSERADCFLWARLVIEEILRARTPSLEWVQQKIVSMPSTVESLYHQYLQTVGLNDRSHLRNLFSWLLASVRHLHLAELQHALRFDGRFSESQSRDQDTVRRGGLSSIRPLLESCAPLVEITADSKVRLVHHTFKEYLLSRRSGFTQRSNLAQEHEILARVCLQYLASNVWTERIAQVTEPLPAACLEKDDRSTIEDYAVANWLFHYQIAEAQSITLTGELQRSLEYALDAVSGHISCFDRVSPSSTMNAILRVCSGHRLRKLGKMYLDMGTDPNAGSCSYCKSPLHLAVENGHMELISILLRAGASVDLVSHADGYTPLHRAASLGHHEAVQLLLSSGARVDAVADTLGETPLHLASARGHIQVVKVLMDYDAEINSQRRLSEETPLHLAAVAGRLGVVMCLLDGRTTTKEELELYTTITQQPYYQTWSREFLTGPDWQGKYTWEADERSLAEDDVNKFLSFSKRYADVNARTREGLTALKLAVMGGHTEVAQFLLCRGAFKEVQSWDGQSVLHLAMKTGQLETVKFLLEAVIERELGTAADWHSVQQLVEKNDQDQILPLLLWRAFGSEFSKTFRHPLMCSARSVGNKGMMKNARKGEEGLEFKNGTWSRGPALICAFRGLDVQGAWTSCPSFYDNS